MLEEQPLLKFADEPEYSLRRSPRAKYLGLKYSARGGLEVVIPQRMRVGPRDIESLLRRHRDWIKRCREKIAAGRPATSGETALPPEIIHLPYRGESLRLRYRLEKGTAKVRLEQNASGVFLIRGAVENRELCFQVIRAALAELGRRCLVPELEKISRELRLSYKRASVRGQKTRWASCSSRGTVSLNYKLLFLPPELTRYVMIHELCHTVHMNHSREFWKLVEYYDGEYKKHEARLKEAARSLPAWL